MAEKKRSRKKYDCLKCPAYCCSYAHIPATDEDVTRLAEYFGLSFAAAKKKYTKKGDKDTPRVLRHQSDEHFETICQFIDTETRNCTVYHARPAICREFPTQTRCGYYDFLMFEREVQDDPEWVATTS
ncbi:YkgJ family cysteine cluster protein [Parvularcula sp. LCG005]|uniref:YkgJ family cysteine cluster protein n=1 Tax=Parvularcula sp. LCG005 TaxID=3078805 RepID=UPI0029435AD9|nr:YkgJ family cysteine cluster protein [Parvularcula sp. LCG005]WOI52534.1 YkgJ family cysteine cluster protein [Parvularcula sp. LCG005]